VGIVGFALSIVGSWIRNPTTRRVLPTPDTGAIVGFVGFCEKVGEEITRQVWVGTERVTERDDAVEILSRRTVR